MADEPSPNTQNEAAIGLVLDISQLFAAAGEAEDRMKLMLDRFLVIGAKMSAAWEVDMESMAAKTALISASLESVATNIKAIGVNLTESLGAIKKGASDAATALDGLNKKSFGGALAATDAPKFDMLATALGGVQLSAGGANAQLTALLETLGKVGSVAQAVAEVVGSIGKSVAKGAKSGAIPIGGGESGGEEEGEEEKGPTKAQRRLEVIGDVTANASPDSTAEGVNKQLYEQLQAEGIANQGEMETLRKLRMSEHEISIREQAALNVAQNYLAMPPGMADMREYKNDRLLEAQNLGAILTKSEAERALEITLQRQLKAQKVLAEAAEAATKGLSPAQRLAIRENIDNALIAESQSTPYVNGLYTAEDVKRTQRQRYISEGVATTGEQSAERLAIIEDNYVKRNELNATIARDRREQAAMDRNIENDAAKARAETLAQDLADEEAQIRRQARMSRAATLDANQIYSGRSAIADEESALVAAGHPAADFAMRERVRRRQDLASLPTPEPEPEVPRSGFETLMANASRGMGRISGPLNMIRHAGMGMMINGAIAAGAFVEAIKSASTFDDDLHKLKAIAGETTLSFGEMKGQIIQIGEATNQEPNDLVKALYEIESAGYHGAAAMATLRATAMMSTAGQIDTDIASPLMAKTLKAYGISPQDAGAVASKFSDVYIKAMSLSLAQPKDFVPAMSNVLDFGSKLGLSLNELSAALASVTQTTKSAATGSTYLRNTLFRMLDPSNIKTRKEAAAETEYFKKTGKGADLSYIAQGTEQAYIRSHGFGQIFEDLNKAAAASKGGGEATKLFPDMRSFAGILDLMATYKKNLADIQNSQNATASAFKTMMDSLEAVWKGIKVRGEAFAIALTDAIKGPIETIGHDVMKLLDWFNNLSPGMQSLIVKAVAVAGALTIAAGAVSLLVYAIEPLAVLFRVIGMVFGLLPGELATAGAAAQSATGGLATFGAGLLRMAGWVGVAVLAFGILKNHWDTVTLAISASTQYLRIVMGGLFGWIPAALQSLSESFKHNADETQNALSKAAVAISVFGGTALGMFVILRGGGLAFSILNTSFFIPVAIAVMGMAANFLKGIAAAAAFFTITEEAGPAGAAIDLLAAATARLKDAWILADAAMVANPIFGWTIALTAIALLVGGIATQWLGLKHDEDEAAKSAANYWAVVARGQQSHLQQTRDASDVDVYGTTIIPALNQKIDQLTNKVMGDPSYTAQAADRAIAGMSPAQRASYSRASINPLHDYSYTIDEAIASRLALADAYVARQNAQTDMNMKAARVKAVDASSAGRTFAGRPMTQAELDASDMTPGQARLAAETRAIYEANKSKGMAWAKSQAPLWLANLDKQSSDAANAALGQQPGAQGSRGPVQAGGDYRRPAGPEGDYAGLSPAEKKKRLAEIARAAKKPLPLDVLYPNLATISKPPLALPDEPELSPQGRAKADMATATSDSEKANADRLNNLAKVSAEYAHQVNLASELNKAIARKAPHSVQDEIAYQLSESVKQLSNYHSAATSAYDAGAKAARDQAHAQKELTTAIEESVKAFGKAAAEAPIAFTGGAFPFDAGQIAGVVEPNVINQSGRSLNELEDKYKYLGMSASDLQSGALSNIQTLTQLLGVQAGNESMATGKVDSKTDLGTLRGNVNLVTGHDDIVSQINAWMDLIDRTMHDASDAVAKAADESARLLQEAHDKIERAQVESIRIKSRNAKESYKGYDEAIGGDDVTSVAAHVRYQSDMSSMLNANEAGLPASIARSNDLHAVYLSARYSADETAQAWSAAYVEMAKDQYDWSVKVKDDNKRVESAWKEMARGIAGNFADAMLGVVEKTETMGQAVKKLLKSYGESVFKSLVEQLLTPSIEKVAKGIGHLTHQGPKADPALTANTTAIMQNTAALLGRIGVAASTIPGGSYAGMATILSGKAGGVISGVTSSLDQLSSAVPKLNSNFQKIAGPGSVLASKSGTASIDALTAAADVSQKNITGAVSSIGQGLTHILPGVSKFLGTAMPYVGAALALASLIPTSVDKHPWLTRKGTDVYNPGFAKDLLGSTDSGYSGSQGMREIAERFYQTQRLAADTQAAASKQSSTRSVTVNVHPGAVTVNGIHPGNTQQVADALVDHIATSLGTKVSLENARYGRTG